MSESPAFFNMTDKTFRFLNGVTVTPSNFIAILDIQESEVISEIDGIKIIETVVVPKPKMVNTLGYIVTEFPKPVKGVFIIVPIEVAMALGSSRFDVFTYYTEVPKYSNLVKADYLYQIKGAISRV